MKRCFSIFAAALAGLALSAGPAQAADVTKCTAEIAALPAVLNISGVWCLKSNLKYNNGAGFAIRVARKDVTIEMSGFTIDGTAAGLGTQAIGIFAVDKQNLTIRNGTIKGFFIGVDLDENTGTSSGHLIEHLRVDGAKWSGIRVAGDQVIIRDNHIINTGPGTNEVNALGVWVKDCQGAFVHRNSIQGVTESNNTFGIYVDECDEAVVRENDITAIGPASFETGIYLINQFPSNRIDVRENNITGDVGDYGIFSLKPANNSLTCVDNVIHDFATPLENCDLKVGNRAS